ncbi:MAG: COX15/CtaA family protein [Rickettsiales bacterium]|nr:COX15/CtaA family protein [Rickettsiales bacterium]
MSTYLMHRDFVAVKTWLLVCLALVVCMVAVGGYTRLSGSGLSITQWKLVHGAIPPMDEQEWQEEFSAYQATPQYKKVNQGMSLDAFKTIYWPEYAHRLLGRLIGIVFLLPLVFFWLRKSITPRFAGRLALIFALGGLQGLVGWIMVASGLVDRPYVHPVKLALHLGLAFALFSFLVWAFLDISRNGPLIAITSKTRHWFRLWSIVLFVQILVGALVAGSHAGLIYNSWPDMGGAWIPADIVDSSVVLVQFIHRKLALFVVISYGFWWCLHRQYVKNNHLGKWCAGLTLLIGTQFILGVWTLLGGATGVVPLHLAWTHQMIALGLLAVSVMLLHRLSWHKVEG